jgi:putative transcriptional regulator
MTLRHHPSDERLVEHVAGALPDGHRLVIRSHVGVCAQCARTVALAEAVGGALLGSLAPAAMRQDALERVLASIERPSPAAPAPAGAPAGWIAVPDEVVLAARRSTRRLLPGVWMAPVARGPGRARAYLLGLEPGLSVPRHRHRGAELTCVVKGAFVDGEALFGPGDFVETDGAGAHGPRVAGDGECVCLIACEGPLVGVGWLGRLLIPLMGA